MDTFALIAILTPIVTKIISLAEKQLAGKRGPVKKAWALREILKSWNQAVQAGLITGDFAKIPVGLIMPIISMLIDGLIATINTAPAIKNPKSGVKK